MKTPNPKDSKTPETTKTPPLPSQPTPFLGMVTDEEEHRWQMAWENWRRDSDEKGKQRG